MTPDLLFSKQEMWNNTVFVDLMIEYSKISKMPILDMLMSNQTYENFYLSLYRASVFWFGIFKDAEWWREGCE